MREGSLIGIGQELMIRRTLKGLKQCEVAREAGVHKGTLSCIERDRQAALESTYRRLLAAIDRLPVKAARLRRAQAREEEQLSRFTDGGAINNNGSIGY